MAHATSDDIEYEGLSNAGLGINMIAGGLAGISEHVVMYPVDSIKVSACHPPWSPCSCPPSSLSCTTLGLKDMSFSKERLLDLGA